MIPQGLRGRCRFCDHIFWDYENKMVGDPEECPICGKADPIKPVCRVEGVPIDEWRPKKHHPLRLKLAYYFFAIAEYSISSQTRFVCFGLPVLYVLGYCSFKFVQYLWGVIF